MSPHHTPSVTYIPPQPTPLTPLTSLTSTPRARDSPLALAWRDIRTLFSVLYLLPKLCQPSASSNPSDELSPTGPNACHLALLVCVTALQSVLFPAAVVVGVVVPGFVSGLVWAGLLGVVWVLCWPVQGGMVVESRVGVAVDEHRHKGERWVFVNGMMVGHRGLLNNCDRLSFTFRRPITGIHNPTYGLLWDLLECIFQRAFAYNTYATRYTYDHLKTLLADPAVHKVVLLAHSQGGIIVSMALDMLFTDLPPANIAKLEVYTFGSAAAHFNNPLRAIVPSPSPSRACTVLSPARVIRHIEHYVNNEDIVPRWGVLWNIRDVHTRYSGKVFIRNHATGHMFNQHYLANIFPLRTDDQGTPGEGLGGGEDGADDGRRPGLEAGFLDRVVMVDERTCREREVYAMEMFGLASGNRQGHTAVVGSEDEGGDEGGDESLAPSRDLPDDNDNLVPKLRVVSNGNGTANTNANANATANGAVANPNVNAADDQQQPHPHPQQDLNTDDSAVTSPGPSSISNGHGVCGYDHDHHGEHNHHNHHNHQLIDDGDGDGAAGGTGKTVRELSRLWRYLGGGVPGD